MGEHREFLQALCDQRNAAMDPASKARGLVWFVTKAGEMRLDISREASEAHTKRIERRRESERARFVRRHLEAEQNSRPPAGMEDDE